MNIMLITILLTLLGAGLIGYLIWLGAMSSKSIKFRKQATTNIKCLEDSVHFVDKESKNNINNLEKSISNEIENINNNNNSRFDKIWNKIKELEK